MAEMRTCTECGEVKPLTEFHRRSDGHGDGYNRQCKRCRITHTIEQRKANPEKTRAATRRYYVGNTEKVTAANSKWAAANRDKINASQRRIRAEHPERQRASSLKYKAANPEKGRQDRLRRRARMKEAGVFSVSPKDSRRLLTDPCYLCGGKAEHVDHIVPLVRGGRHSIGNLAPACQSCNLRKQDKFLVEFKAWLMAVAT